MARLISSRSEGLNGARPSRDGRFPTHTTPPNYTARPQWSPSLAGREIILRPGDAMQIDEPQWSPSLAGRAMTPSTP